MLIELVLMLAAGVGWASLIGNLAARRPRSVVDALKQNRTTLALLVNFAISTGLCWADVPFNFWFWVLIDVAAGLAILNEDNTRDEIAILILYPVAWACYAIGGDVRLYGSSAVVVAQFLLTSPRQEMIAQVRRLFHYLRPPDRADLIVVPRVA